jgi:hypothetical protein
MVLRKERVYPRSFFMHGEHLPAGIQGDILTTMTIPKAKRRAATMEQELA